MKERSDDLVRSQKTKWLNERDNFISSIEDCPIRSLCLVDGRPYTLMLGNSQIKLFRFKNDIFEVEDSITLLPNDISSVSTKLSYTSYTYNDYEVLKKKITKPKSPVKRAIVGGLVAGPVGAVAGAITGIGEKSAGTENVVIKTPHKVSRVSDYTILVNTRSMHIPMFSVPANDENDQERWVALINGFASKTEKPTDNTETPTNLRLEDRAQQA